jgi:uncharacterized membrane protein YdjX (TVP38/TMEM64 family)
MQPEAPKISIRAIVLGIIAYVVVTLGLIYAIETIGVDAIREFIQRAGPLAPLVYIAIKASTYVFAPLSSGPLQLSSGVLFGLWAGTLYTLIGEVLGGTISFLIARHLGRPIVRRFVGDEGMRRVDGFVSQLGAWRTLIYVRLFLFAIYDFISYAAGFARNVTLLQYVVVSSLIGAIPTFLFVAAGASLADNRDMVIVIYFGIILLSTIPVGIHQWRQRSAKRHPTED